LASANPDLNISIENDDSHIDRPRPIVRRRVDIFDPQWLGGHPDLSVGEYSAYMHMVIEYQERIVRGEIPDWQTYASCPYGFKETQEFIKESARYLRALCAELKISLVGKSAKLH
jgi:hypothetical protein